MARGSLRIYLGASPGVGKTYRMLGEGVRRAERGTDVVIGIVVTHNRAQTAAQIRNLEIIPPKEVAYRGTTIQEMDIDAVLARKPAVVLVDEYAHTNAPGSANEKRWQDVEQLLDAGIDVISTLNIQHLESLNDVVSQITGAVQRETVPDDIVRRADQLELVDMSPEAIRRRMAHGNIYQAERIDAALANYFRPGNLGALRELALLWLADRVEESLQGYLDAHGIATTWETRERVVVGITGIAGGDALIRRAARMAGRVSGELVGVHVAVDDGLTAGDAEALSAQRRLVTELGGTVHEVVGHDTAEALAAFARREKATQLVLGASRRSRWHEVLHGSFVARITRLAGDIDIHVIASPEAADAARTSRNRTPAVIDRRRTWTAWVLTVAGLPLLTALAVLIRDHAALSTVLLIALAFVLLIAAIGGRIVAGVAAIAASLLVNWYFVKPYHTLTIAEFENSISLLVFVVVAVAVGSLVDVASRRAVEARRARLEAEALARSATTLAADQNPLPLLVDQLRATFDLAGVAIVGPDDPSAVATAGDTTGRPTASLTLFSTVVGVPGPSATLHVFGRTLSDDDLRLLRVLADQLAVAIDNRRLAAEAGEASALADIDAVRTALLRAVSHDLRTPLASIKAMISGLRDTSVAWTPAQLAEALLTVDEETDRLNRLVGNLLDASRLQIGALAVDLHPATLADIAGAALQSINSAPDAVEVCIPRSTPAVLCDPTLLERSVANVVANAIRHSPPGIPVRIECGVVGDTVHLRIVDRGPGIAAAERTKVLAPFQRLGDQHTTDGVGLGLSIAQGFVDAMAGTFTLDDTPGGGLTVTITLPRVDEAAT
ncbi:MAG: osmosensitive channel histidine kinase KdpD [Ilumatobacteraceae bacterium]|nr:osmosensitive channel histidine kinase KdpD [Ilumatobacteraceae bacterium]